MIRRTRSARSGLFRRIYLTFVLTVAIATVLALVAGWALGRRYSREWMADAMVVLGENHDQLADHLGDPQALKTDARLLSENLQTGVGIFGKDGARLAGIGPKRLPPRALRHFRRLAAPRVRQGKKRGQGAAIQYPITNERGNLRAIVHVMPRERQLAGPISGGVVLMLGLLGLSARWLTLSLTRRLTRLERSADRIAHGELDHRVRVEKPTQDELDQLGVAFNEMADKVQRLITGQRTLLANVSHELRTPIARVKVLLEILEERAAALTRETTTAGAPHLQRLQSGLAEMTTDTNEIETLISDLLTSGRLELRAGGEKIDPQPVDVVELLSRAAQRFDARVVDHAGISVVDGETLLLTRLFSNLLSNARRACPDGELTITVDRDEDLLRIAVEDEGAGIAPEHREAIFEPFTRLDGARSRDKGGVGLGLYLCRQIVTAHNGGIEAQDRADGQPGARLVVWLPLQPSYAGSGTHARASSVSL